MKRSRKRLLKFFAIFTVLTLLNEIAFPTVALALTDGPRSPDFSSFTPVATTNMVDLTTGDFNYNLPVLEIPGTEGGGYALSLSYNSGVNSEQEASWVGFGWSLNPGAINRSLRGFPDDYNGEKVKLYNKARPNWSITTGKNLGVEAFTIEVAVDKSLRFNNHYGYFSSTGLSFGICGVGLGLNFSGDEVTFSANINPYKVISAKANIASDVQKLKTGNTIKNGIDGSVAKKIARYSAGSNASSVNLAGGNYGLFTFSDATRATSYQNFTGINVNFSAGINANPVIVPVGLNGGGHGNINLQTGYYETEAKAYGYFNHSLAGDVMLDYYSEKASDINKRDIFIGMPFANADIFGVTGEGISGGFRGYNDKVNSYKYATPGGSSSEINVLNLGIDISIGSNFGAGMSLGKGHQKNSMKSWSHIPLQETQPVLRFNHDLGGKITYGDDNLIAKANLSTDIDLPGITSVDLSDESLAQPMNMDEAGSASYIDFHTYSQINNNAINSFTKKVNFVPNEALKSPIGGSTIMEYSIFNEHGANYVYGQPVFTRNETNLSFDIGTDNPDHKLVNNFLAFRSIPLSSSAGKYGVNNDQLRNNANKTVLGEVRNSPYVCDYLLSQITQPNYVDVNNNGPDESDFGGWTKFSYRKKYGSFSNDDNNWYRYRSPYAGLHYSQNSISDQKDDMGSVTTGEKEMYYLETVETKTHIAFFVTNKYVDNNADYEIGNGSAVTDPTKARKDGMGAVDLSDSEDPAAKSTSVANDLKKNELEYLERIVLFSKAQPDKPLKVVYFGYDYSLVPNTPNNTNTQYDYLNSGRLVDENTGKLTLRRVWFEYQGTSPARISPYEFSYVYKKSSSVKAGHTYYQEFDELSSDAGGAQNPFYAPEQLDPWGNVMPFGKERHEYDIPWHYQGAYPDFLKNELRNNWRNKAETEDEFDPAAWHLKCIKLPSGGEIHIQYEEKDYCYVQDEPVMGMASLINNNNSYNNPWYDINVDDLGCNPRDENEVNALKGRIEELFASTLSPASGSYADKVYYKFLFDLTSQNAGSEPDLKNPSAEYISGFAEFRSAEVISVGDKYTIRIHLDSPGKKQLPRNLAYDFYIHQRQGMLKGSRSFGPIDFNKTFDATFTNIAEGSLYNDVQISDVLSVIMKLFPIYNSFNDVVKINTPENQACAAMSNALSYIKLPMLRAKKGGGVRVRRLLLYDAGLENGDASLSGVQYHYVLDDGVTSSGVATNEPSGAREENPLVKYMVRKGQSLFSSKTTGIDKKQTEGPLGESLLPMAAVYHSRVVTENIHSDKVKTGFTVNEFYTTKDYPFSGNYSDNLRKSSNGEPKMSYNDVTGKGIEFTNLEDDSKTDFLPPSLSPFFTYGVNKLWMAQGFRFIQNSMNGLLKRITAYGGEYQSEPTENGKDTDRGYPVSITRHEYYEPGEKIAMIKPSADGGFEQYFDTPGKEMEIAIEGKQMAEDVFSIDVSFDATVGIVGVIPILFVPVIPKIGINMDLIATHSTTKVIRYPAILKSVTTNTDGVINRTEYQAFDAYTGKPVIVKAYDGHTDLDLLMSNGSKPGEVYQFAMPASWKYPEMGPKSKSTSNANQLSAQTLTITSYGNAPSLSWIDGSDDPISNVLGVNVNTYAKNWETSWSDTKIKNDFSISEDVIARLKAIWRPQAGYIYKTTDNVDPAGNQVYDKGFFTIDNMFDWNTGASQANWIKVSEITKYSPHGQAIEEVDVMNIPSAAIYGPQYGNNLPVMIASNANYNDIYFNDYENPQNNAFRAHSGKYSIPYANQLTIVDDVYITRHLKQKGGLLKLWMSFENGEDTPDEMTLNVGAGSVALRKMASSGLWNLYESSVSGSLLPNVGSKADIKVDDYNGTGAAYIDDVRFQPSDAQAVCYVFDLKSLRLLAQFDDQHYGMYYKYNQEGALTHKIVETERGMKTVQETHYNTPKTLKQ